MAEIKYLDLTGLQRYDQKIKEVINIGLDAKADKAEVDLNLNSKIGKDDVMLDLSEATTEVYNLTSENPSTPVLTGNFSIQSFEESHPGGDDVEVAIYNGSQSIYYGTFANISETFKCEDGVVTFKPKRVPEDIPATQYTLSSDGLTICLVGSNVTLSLIMNVEKGDKLNTHDSLVYLNNTKADKTEVESSLEHLNNTLSTKITAEDLPTAVSQLSNDAGYAVAGNLKIAEVTEGLGENVAKAYKFEGGAESTVIEIPKDQTLKSVELGKIVDDTFVVDPTGEILRFTYIITDGSEKVVDVNVSNLITEAELDPVYDLIDTKLNAADVLTVSNDEIDAMFA